MSSIASDIRSEAQASGFPLVGFVTNQDAPRYESFLDWLRRGYHGSMHYLESRQEAYRNPQGVLEGCRTVVMLATPYESNPHTSPRKSPPPQSTSPLSTSDTMDATERRTQIRDSECQIGHYATGPADYHDVIRTKLNQLASTFRDWIPRSQWRGVVDTAPLLEREFAQLAGLGWVGKNTLLLHREWGSYFFLAALLTDADFPIPSPVTATDHCGTCTACLDSCPTQAFPQPHQLNAQRCISYLTIEHRGSIDIELRSQMQDWIFGCDVCQQVCPWNRKRRDEVLDIFRADQLDAKTSLRHWLQLDENEFRRLYRKTPFYRTKLAGMQRNAIIAAANTNRLDLLPEIESLAESTDAVVSETARWAIQLLTNSNIVPG